MPSSHMSENYRRRTAQGIALKTASTATVGTPRPYRDMVEHLASGQTLPTAHDRRKRKP
jgi:hypothetical protein